MFVCRAERSTLTDRLDAESYNPDFLAAAAVLSASGLRVETVDAIAAKLRCGPFGSSLLASAYVANGIPFLSPTAFSGGVIIDEAIERITPSDHARLSGTAFTPPAVVFARVGHPHCTVVPERIGQFNLHGDVIGLLPVARVDARYLWAYFYSRQGGALLRQSQAGTTRPRINTPNLGRIPVSTPSETAQQYIGSKVRQAEALREHARQRERAFTTAVAIIVPLADGRSRHSRVTPADLVDDLNPGRFTPDRRAVRSALNVRLGARRIGGFCHIVAESTAAYAANTPYLGLDGISSNSIDITTGTVGAAQVSGTSRKVRAGPCISKLRPYLNKAAYIPADMGTVVGSTELLGVVPDDGIHPAFVYGLLKLDTTVRQLNPVATGATHPRIDADEVLDILVPWHAEHEALGRSLEVAQDCYRGARSLVSAARLLVEALIERKVTEPELIAAATDPAADRALLARLTTGGLDAAGDPLFPNLETLASLLAQKDTR